MTGESSTADQAEADALAAIVAHFESLEVGTRVARTVFFAEADVDEYVQRVGIEYPGRYVDAEGARLVPPGMIFLPPARTFGLQEGPPLARGGFFTAARRSYSRPVRVGETLRFEGTLAGKFERGGYHYVVAEWTASTTAGHEVGSGVEEHTLGSARKPRNS